MTVMMYNQVTTDLQALIQTLPSISDVTIEENDILFPALSKLCKANIRLVASPMEVRAGQDYFSSMNIEIDIVFVDMGNYAEAAFNRNNVVREVVQLIRDNASSFSSDIESTITTNVAFEGGALDDERGFIAAAVIEVDVKAYENR